MTNEFKLDTILRGRRGRTLVTATRKRYLNITLNIGTKIGKIYVQPPAVPILYC